MGHRHSALEALSRHVADPLNAFWRGEPAAPVRVALWQAVVLVPAALGLMVAVPRLEVQHTTLGWLLAGLRFRLLVGTAAVAVPAASALGLLMARSGSGEEAIVAFSLALFWSSSRAQRWMQQRPVPYWLVLRRYFKTRDLARYGA